MFTLLLAWSTAPAAACSGSMAYSLTTAGLLPVDARAVVTGQYAESITVSDEDGHDGTPPHVTPGAGGPVLTYPGKNRSPRSAIPTRSGDGR